MQNRVLIKILTGEHMPLYEKYYYNMYTLNSKSHLESTVQNTLYLLTYLFITVCKISTITPFYPVRNYAQENDLNLPKMITAS